MLKQLSFLSLSALAAALPDGLARTPPMGFNSWTAFGSGVTAADLIGVGQYLATGSNLLDAGYNWVNSDDGWSNMTRAANGALQADSGKFPEGIPGVVKALNALKISFGIYSSASSVVCSGRPGSLYHEYLDAATFAGWGVQLVKYDNCGEYTLGDARYRVFADGVAAAGGNTIISTEPFSLIPTPSHAGYAHFWRTGNDINSDWSTILDRIDRNDKWAPFAGPGHWNDPDMLQVGNGDLSDAECRSHFGLWAITKSPLILGSDVRKLTAAQLAIIGNKDVIAINQDPLGAQARKLAVNGTLLPRFVGIGPCDILSSSSRVDGLPGQNGMTAATMRWSSQIVGGVNGTNTIFQMINNATGRCLGVGTYMGQPKPLLFPCDSTDVWQLWTFPSSVVMIGAIRNVGAVQAVAQGNNPSNATVLAVSNSTLYGAVHGNDPMPLPDISYGIVDLTLAPYNPEPTCDNRNCQNYDPSQSWYYSIRTNTIALAHAPANMYRCFEGPCYQLTTHLPTTDQYCLTQVLSVSNDGVDTTTTTTGGADVWGGALSGSRFVFGLLNRNAVGSGDSQITASWSMLETPGFDDTTSACVRELYTNTSLGVHTGSVTVAVAPHDLAVLLVVPGASTC